MLLMIEVPDKGLKEELDANKYYIDDGEKSYAAITLLYTNKKLDFVLLERDKKFHECQFIEIDKRMNTDRTEIEEESEE